jgi:hypothetical protein
VVELVDRLEADDQRGIAVLLENARGGQRRLEAVRRAGSDDAAKTAQRGRPGWRLGVVRELVEEMLDLRGRVEPADQPPFGGGEGRRWRRAAITVGSGQWAVGSADLIALPRLDP